MRHRSELPVSMSAGTRGSWRDHRERDRDRDYDRGRFDDYEGGRYERPYRTKSGSWGEESGEIPAYYRHGITFIIILY